MLISELVVVILLQRVKNAVVQRKAALRANSQRWLSYQKFASTPNTIACHSQFQAITIFQLLNLTLVQRRAYFIHCILW